MSKKNIYLFEISDVLANQAKLPYSTGLIWSYCIQEKKISENYNLDNWFWYKDDENTVDTIFNNLVRIFEAKGIRINHSNTSEKGVKE